MEAYTLILGPYTYLTYLFTYWLTDLSICPHNALESHLKLVLGFRACFIVYLLFKFKSIM